MLSRVARPRISNDLPGFVAVGVALTGFAAIVGIIVTTLGVGSFRDSVAGMMWFIGLIALLIVPGQLWGRIYTWGMDDESDTPDPEPTPEVLWILLPAAVVVMALGTIVYVL